MKKITEQDIKKVRNHYIEVFGIKKYLQKTEDGFSDNDLALELLDMLKDNDNFKKAIQKVLMSYGFDADYPAIMIYDLHNEQEHIELSVVTEVHSLNDENSECGQEESHEDIVQYVKYKYNGVPVSKEKAKEVCNGFQESKVVGEREYREIIRQTTCNMEENTEDEDMEM